MVCVLATVFVVMQFCWLFCISSGVPERGGGGRKGEGRGGAWLVRQEKEGDHKET